MGYPLCIPVSSLLVETRDCRRANAVCNHEAVLPGLSLGIFEQVDLTPLVRDPRNHLLMGDHGGALLIWSAPGVYDVHDFVLPVGRGKWARDAAQDVFAFVFDFLEARLLWTQTPVENRASRMFNRILGFQSGGVHDVMVGEKVQPMEYFTMEKRPCQ